MNAISPASNVICSSVVHIVSTPKLPNKSVGKQASGMHTEIRPKGGKEILEGTKSPKPSC